MSSLLLAPVRAPAVPLPVPLPVPPALSYYPWVINKMGKQYVFESSVPSAMSGAPC